MKRTGNKQIRTLRSGYTLLELMVAVSIGSIAIAGMGQMMFVLRTNWNDAETALGVARGNETFNERMVRGGLGFGSGLQAAVWANVHKETDGNLHLVYRNGDGSYFDVHFDPSGRVAWVQQADATPWWKAGGSKVETRSWQGSKVVVKDLRKTGSMVSIDYALQVRRGQHWVERPGRFQWMLRTYAGP